MKKMNFFDEYVKDFKEKKRDLKKSEEILKDSDFNSELKLKTMSFMFFCYQGAIKAILSTSFYNDKVKVKHIDDLTKELKEALEEIE